ncbi:allene oxide cyclase barrel-like domain-containing protein [Streptomyces hydrogenans]
MAGLRASALGKVAAASLAAVAVGALAADGAEAGPPARGRVEVLELRVRNDQYTSVDHGPAGPSLGDMDVYSGTGVEDGRDVGRGGGTCQVIHVRGAAVTAQCVITMEVARGSLTMQSLWTKGASPLDMAITGGTGAYAGARGVARFQDIATPDERVRLEILR